MDRRGNITARRAPGRFRCLACKRYVHGTESGHCPSCGLVPPSSLNVPDAMTSIPIWVVLSVVLVVIVALVIVTN